MGSLDDRGVYEYDVTDIVAPLHTLLNLGQGSISAALKDVKQEIIDELTPNSTGWQRMAWLNMNTGWRNIGSASQTKVRRKGDRVFMALRAEYRGSTVSVHNTTGGMTNQVICTLREEWRPQFTQPLNTYGGRPATVGLYADGKVAISSMMGTKNLSKGDYVYPIGTYYMDW